MKFVCNLIIKKSIRKSIGINQEGAEIVNDSLKT